MIEIDKIRFLKVVISFGSEEATSVSPKRNSKRRLKPNCKAKLWSKKKHFKKALKVASKCWQNHP